MQLKLAFLEQATLSSARSSGPWEQIDPRAQIAALEILARLIAQTLAAQSTQKTNDE